MRADYAVRWRNGPPTGLKTRNAPQHKLGRHFEFVDVESVQGHGRRYRFQLLFNCLFVAQTAVFVDFAPTCPFHIFLGFGRFFVMEFPLLVEAVEGLRKQAVFLLEPPQG